MHTIVWVHGFPLSSAIFANQREIPNATHVMPDLPGFGDVPATESEWSVDDYARFVVDQVEEEKAVYAGFSMGGYICLAIARLFPERLAGLILIDTRETADTEEARKGRHESIMKVQQNGIEPVVDSMLPKMITSDAPDELRDHVREIMMSSSSKGVIAALRAMATRPDSSALLPQIKVPTLIVVGEEDPITPPADSERMAKAIPNAKLVKIANAAHLSNVQQHDAFNAAVAQFLG
jgi:3-oxoadipate enol-lactonase